MQPKYKLLITNKDKTVQTIISDTKFTAMNILGVYLKDCSIKKAILLKITATSNNTILSLSF
jgi:hypothetical protein